MNHSIDAVGCMVVDAYIIRTPLWDGAMVWAMAWGTAWGTGTPIVGKWGHPKLCLDEPGSCLPIRHAMTLMDRNARDQREIRIAGPSQPRSKMRQGTEPSPSKTVCIIIIKKCQQRSQKKTETLTTAIDLRRMHSPAPTGSCSHARTITTARSSPAQTSPGYLALS
jgi:hypothetical protein